MGWAADVLFRGERKFMRAQKLRFMAKGMPVM